MGPRSKKLERQRILEHNRRTGTVGQSKKVAILVRVQDGFCAYCDAKFTTDDDESDGPGVWPTFDHVVPKSAGGSDGLANGVAACETCNRLKDDRMPDERELAIHARIQPLALALRDRLAEASAWMDTYTSFVYRRPADMAYVDRERAALTGPPEPG